MKRLSYESQDIFSQIITGLNKKEIDYVVLRSYEGLPEHLYGEDVDIFVYRELEAIPEICERVNGKTKEDNFSDYINRFYRMIVPRMIHPIRTTKRIIQSPNKIVETIDTELFQNYPNHQIQKYTFNFKNLQIDFLNHIYYKSTMNGEKTRVNPLIEESMIDNRRKYGNFYVPSPSDELLHLICRIVFDYPQKDETSIPDYYISRCESLKEELKENNAENRFKTLLRHQFFSADDLVWRHIQYGNYGGIRSSLESFDDY